MSWFELNLKWKILGYFADNPGKEIYVSELAGEIHSGKGAVSVILRDLEKEGVLNRKQYGNSLYYSLNDNFLTRELKVFSFLTKIWEYNLISYFIKQDSNIEFLVVYGSQIQGTNQANYRNEAYVEHSTIPRKESADPQEHQKSYPQCVLPTAKCP